MKALSRWVGAALFAVLFAGSALALDVPPLTGRVVDNAKVLTAEQKNDLIKILEDLEKSTTAQVVILTVKSLEGDTPFEFSQRVFDTWKLGQKDKNNGLLMLFAVKEKAGRVHTGYGLEGVIPDAESVMLGKRLIIPHLPSWRNKKGDDDYYAAMKAGLDRIVALIKEEAKAGDVPPEPEKKEGPGIELLFLLAAVIAAVVGCMHPLWGGAVGAVAFALVAWIIPYALVAIGIAALIGLIIGLLGEIGIRIGIFAVQVFVGGGGGSGGGGFDF